MANLTITKLSPRKDRAVEIHSEDIKGAIDLITEIVIKKVKQKGETSVD